MLFDLLFVYGIGLIDLYCFVFIIFAIILANVAITAELFIINLKISPAFN